MPKPGEETIGVKVCELAKLDPATGNVVLKKADSVVPFMVLLYATLGFAGQVVAEFQLSRHESQFANTLEYAKIIPSILLKRGAPPQSPPSLQGLTVTDLQDNQYFPPSTKHYVGGGYTDVGFCNIGSFSGGKKKILDRAGCTSRWCACNATRAPASYCDGQLDFYRERALSTMGKTGTIMQGDKKDGAVFTFEGERGKGLFFQYDGEGRFVFNPTGDKWSFVVRRILQIPMVVAPGRKVPGRKDAPIKFKFDGMDDVQVAQVKQRIVKWASGALVSELNATEDDITKAGLMLAT